MKKNEIKDVPSRFIPLLSPKKDILHKYTLPNRKTEYVILRKKDLEEIIKDEM